MQVMRILVRTTAMMVLCFLFNACQTDAVVELSPLEEMASDPIVDQYFKSTRALTSAFDKADNEKIIDYLMANQSTNFCDGLPSDLTSVKGAIQYAQAACNGRKATMALHNKYPSVQQLDVNEWQQLHQHYLDYHDSQASQATYAENQLANHQND